MCDSPDMPPPAKTPAAAPAAPNTTASVLKMGERPLSRDGSYGPNTARSKRTLRTDLNVQPGYAGVNVPRMG
jgi:hypothetical protein